MCPDGLNDVWGIPDFGLVIQRGRMLESVQRARPRVVVLSAPSGYGKSVAAAQIASMHDSSLWIDASGQASDSLALLRSLDNATAGRPPGFIGNRVDVLGPAVSEADYVASILGRLSAVAQQELCVVVDDARIEDSDHWLVRLIETFSKSGPRSGTIVITCRPFKLGSLCGTADIVVLDERDLMLDLTEAQQVAHGLLGEDPVDEGSLATMMDVSHGQAALFVVMSRHLRCSEHGLDESRTSADMREELVRLATAQLGAKQMLALAAMALLGHGSFSDLARALCEERLGVAPQDIAAAIPLVRVSTRSARAEAGSFLVHDMAVEAYGSADFIEQLGAESQGLLRGVVIVLESRLEFDRAGILVLGHEDIETSEWLEPAGAALLEQGHIGLLNDLIDSIPVSQMIQRPRLLVVHSSLLRETNQLQEALNKAIVARDLSDYDRDASARIDALILVASICTALGKFEDVRDNLDQLRAMDSSDLGTELDAVVHAMYGIVSAFVGDGESARSSMAGALELVDDPVVSEGVRAKVFMHAAVLEAMMFGRFSEAAAKLSRARDASDLPVSLRVLLGGNLGVCLCESGRLSRGSSVLRETLRLCEEHDMDVHHHSFLAAMGAVHFGNGRTEVGLEMTKDATEMSQSIDDGYSVAYNRIYWSTMLRSCGRVDDSLRRAEQAMEYFSGVGARLLECLASLEIAASLLALGDVDASARNAASIRTECAAADASYHVLRADMILAEVARRHDRIHEAVSRFMEHEDYILSESSNWQIAMYIRAFPELLGLLATAIDPDRLPAHLLRMILPVDARRILLASRPIMEPDAWHRLSARIVGDEEASELENESDEAPCRVKLFGGLDVRIGDHVVADRDWRKRKARLLFAMLVVKQGADVPRDIILEHLWPDMEEPRARNNLYVVWSAMKSALTPDADKEKGSLGPFTESVGGVCRAVAGSIRSDVDEFEAMNVKARLAADEGRVEAAVRAYERMAEIYRGPLLPGDLYEDWFDDARTHYRAEFGDAMLRAARLLSSINEQPRAIHLLRRAIAQDPWREDLYQEALKRQIDIGQRSAAIETYVACKDRLAQDLGLDPSQATRRLYDCILAMEDGPMEMHEA